MSREVWKFLVPVDDQDHQLPARVVHVAALDHATLVVWCEAISDEQPARTQPHRVFGTGHPLPFGAQHRGTVAVGPFVWHLYNVGALD